MKAGGSIALIAVGAILAFAVSGSPSFLNIHTVGYVLIIVGVVGLYFQRRAWTSRQVTVRRTSGSAPGVTEVTEMAEEEPPPYVMTNPGRSRAEAGLPPEPMAEDDEVIPVVTQSFDEAPLAGHEQVIERERYVEPQPVVIRERIIEREPGLGAEPEVVRERVIDREPGLERRPVVERERIVEHQPVPDARPVTEVVEEESFER
ncbi:MAG TPA: hypothetical protein VH478_22440 [Trebonia sp.]|jgi:hypothetical protein|nr:hypothetical protein [Trebonia sp.]